MIPLLHWSQIPRTFNVWPAFSKIKNLYRFLETKKSYCCCNLHQITRPEYTNSPH